jgi:SNF2 family DNA or RNA helicase
VDGKKIIYLPPKTHLDKSLVLGLQEQQVYDTAFEKAKEKFNEFLRAGTVMKNYHFILVWILRLRQLCCHPHLAIENPDNIENPPISTKIQETLNTLSHVPNNEKIIIFSSFVAYLDILRTFLDPSVYLMYTGKMNSKSRNQTIEMFNTDPLKRILLVSIKAGSVGLNLAVANHVIINDIWYNNAVEDQAISRAFRYGQNKPVFITRLLIKNSIEDRILAIQNNKMKLFNGIVEKNVSRLTLEDLVSIFK